MGRAQAGAYSRAAVRATEVHGVLLRGYSAYLVSFRFCLPGAWAALLQPSARDEARRNHPGSADE